MTWPVDTRYLTVVDGATLVNADLFNGIQDGVISVRFQAQLETWKRLVLPRLRIGGDTRPSNASADQYCFALGPEGFIYASGVAMRTSNFRGNIFQETVGGSTVLGYRLVDDELATTHDAAHATLDRIDLIAVKLTENGAAVTLTKQVVKGTAMTVGTATEPAIPVGFCRWGSVLIPAAHTGVFTRLHLRDWRYPCGSVQGGSRTGSEITSHEFPTQGINIITATAAAQAAIVWLPRKSYARLLNIQTQCRISAGGYIKLARVEFSNSPAGFFTMIDVMADQDTAGGNARVVLYQYGKPSGQPERGPLWSGGFASPELLANDLDEMLALVFSSGAAGDSITWVNWEFAE